MKGEASLSLYFPGITFIIWAECLIAKYQNVWGICFSVKDALDMRTTIFQCDLTRLLADCHPAGLAIMNDRSR
jgi:hypothetical protein